MKSIPAILLTAWLGGLLSFLTVSAHAADGTPAWTNFFSGPGTGLEVASSIAVDGSGNSFVTGYSAGVGSGYDYATIKYSSAGLPLWTNRFTGPGAVSDIAYALAVDGNGDVIVTGYSNNGGSNREDYATIKYSNGGIPLWTNLFNSGPNQSDWALALAVDGQGDIIVTGSSGTIKYSNAGIPLWTNLSGGGAVAINPSGNAIVIGSATTMYSSAGVPLWTNLFPAKAVAVAGNGDVYVAGSVLTSVTNYNYDYVTIKYSGAGVSLWTNYYNGTRNSADYANALAVDAGGNVYVTGSSYGTEGIPNPQSSQGFVDYATLKYSSAGVPLWTNRYNGPQNLGDKATSLAVDAGGNVYVTGSTGDAYKAGTAYKFATLKYSTAGVPLWTNLLSGSGAVKVMLDGSANAYVTGGYGAYATIKYLNVIDAPAITAQPLNQTATGSGGTFFVLASGTPPFSYQWQLHGTNISGANGPAYNLANPTADDVGLYTVEICNAAGCITSAPATLGLMSLDIHPVLNLQAPIGTAYRIDFSEDLGAPTNWYILTNLTLPTSPYLFVDPTPSRQAQRFYRALQQ